MRDTDRLPSLLLLDVVTLGALLPGIPRSPSSKLFVFEGFYHSNN